MVITSASIGSYGAQTAGTLTGSLALLVNSAIVATISPGTQDLPTATTSTVPFVKYSSCFFAVRAGDVIEVDFSGLSGVTLLNMQLVLFGSAELTA
jgi:hypothetical protein